MILRSVSYINWHSSIHTSYPCKQVIFFSTLLQSFPSGGRSDVPPVLYYNFLFLVGHQLIFFMISKTSGIIEFVSSDSFSHVSQRLCAVWARHYHGSCFEPHICKCQLTSSSYLQPSFFFFSVSVICHIIWLSTSIILMGTKANWKRAMASLCANV